MLQSTVHGGQWTGGGITEVSGRLVNPSTIDISGELRIFGSLEVDSRFTFPASVYIVGRLSRTQAGNFEIPAGGTARLSGARVAAPLMNNGTLQIDRLNLEGGSNTVLSNFGRISALYGSLGHIGAESDGPRLVNTVSGVIEAPRDGYLTTSVPVDNDGLIVVADGAFGAERGISFGANSQLIVAPAENAWGGLYSYRPVELGGRLIIQTQAGYLPISGERRSIVGAPTVTGSFSSVTGDVIEVTQTRWILSMSNTQSATQLDLVATIAPSHSVSQFSTGILATFCGFLALGICFTRQRVRIGQCRNK
jgi:hypothetical protein